MQELETLLEQAKMARAMGNAPSAIFEKAHPLAEAEYEPAIDFFRSFLYDPDWDWRLEGLQLLGFHYVFPPNSEIIGEIRQLLLEDPNDVVRAAAASALGRQLRRTRAQPRWPDVDLLRAMQQDPDREVRWDAFEALLTSAGLPFPQIMAGVEHAKRIGEQPTVADAKRVLREGGIEPEPTT